MGFLADLILEAKTERFEQEIKEAYQMGFRDGRLFPNEPRSCEVEGETCRFHRFVDEDKALLRVNVFCRDDEMVAIRRNMDRCGYIPNGCTTEIIRHTFALVEFPDGHLKKVEVERVRFLDKDGEEAEE